MEVLTPKPLRDYLEAKARLHHLHKDMVLFYPQQIPMTALWLHSGVLRLNFETKSSIDCQMLGLYFLDELSRQQAVTFSAKVLAGSQIWVVTRSEMEEFLLTTSA